MTEECEECETCGGSGKIPVTSSGSWNLCPDCKGAGKVIKKSKAAQTSQLF